MYCQVKNAAKQCKARVEHHTAYSLYESNSRRLLFSLYRISFHPGRHLLLFSRCGVCEKLFRNLGTFSGNFENDGYFRKIYTKTIKVLYDNFKTWNKFQLKILDKFPQDCRENFEEVLKRFKENNKILSYLIANKNCEKFANILSKI